MQSKTVSVGPVTAAVTNQICASQTPNAGQMVLNGAGVSALLGSINNVATSQNPAAAGNLTLVSTVVQFVQPRYVYITSAGNDSAFSFTITGTDANWNPLTETITGGNTKAVVTTKQFTSVSSVYVNGDCGSVQVGSFAQASFTGNTARQVTITMTGNESTNTFTVTGTDLNGNSITESVAGVNNSTVTTNSYFYTVTSIRIANNAAASPAVITAGMTNTAASNWIRFDDFAPSNISIQCNVSGFATYTVQSTLSDPNDPFTPTPRGSMIWVNSSDTAVVAATTTQQSNFLFAPKFARVILTTTSTGSVTAIFLQSSNGPI